MRTATRIWLRRAVGCAMLGFMVALQPGSLRAQDYPHRPMTLVVPLAAGGAMDIVARTVAQKLSERLGKPVVVENRVGGGTVSAATSVAKAAPDGYTLMFTPGPTLTTNLAIYKSLPYDPRKDFVPIGLTSQVAFAFVVNPSLPVASLADFIKYAKDRPGALILGSPGVATMPHLAGEILMSKTGIEIRHAPYRGSPAALNDVVAGHVHMMFADPSISVPLLGEGRLRGLGVSSRHRIAVLPDLAPMAEIGIPGFEATNWHMIVAPAHTPADIVQKLHAELMAVNALPEVKQQIEKIGLLPMASPTPEALRSFLDQEIATWSKLVQQIGLAGSQ
ncbi:MAG: tripartite tricarboxylate transporter substrate binding protein [Hyphomicrobiales bacterium]|nr:tripartite tricarboxylate transporter substrate binding protein [Hyphomicrobiales bacterium]